MRLTHKISVAAVACVLAKFLLSGLQLKFSSYELNFAPIDSMVIAAILTPCLGAPHLESWVATKGGKDV